MLGAMRRGAKSWVAKGLMLLLIASFAVWGIGDVFSFRLDSAVAEVGDRAVTAEAYADALQRARGRLSQEAGQAISYQDMRASGIDRTILQGLVRDEAFAAELDRLGIAAPDAAVADAIRQNPAFQQPGGGGFSDPGYRLALTQAGFSPAEFEALTRELLGQELLTEIAAGATVAPRETARRLAARQLEARGLSLIRLPVTAVETPELPDEATLQAYFEEYAEAYRLPERRSGQYLHVSIEALAAGIEPEEEAVRAAYEADIGRYRTEATRTLDQLPLPEDEAAALAERAISGATSFEALARRLGEDPADLDLGTVAADDLPPATAEAAFARAEPGIVGPVETPGGPVLLRIRAATEGGTQPFEAVRDEIADRIARDRALERAPALASAIEDARAAGTAFAEIGEIEGVELGRFEGLARDGSLAGGGRAEGLAARPRFREEAFTALDFEERELVSTEAGGFFVVLVERIEESRIPELREVRDAVLADWQADARQEAVLARAEALAASAGPRADLSALAAETGEPVETLEALRRAQMPQGIGADTAERIFAAPEGRILAAPLTTSGAVIIRVDSVEEPERALLAARTEEIAERLAEGVGEDARELFARAIVARHGVTVDQAAVQSVFDLLGGQRGDGP